jgi:hypothetical protein
MTRPRTDFALRSARCRMSKAGIPTLSSFKAAQANHALRRGAWFPTLRARLRSADGPAFQSRQVGFAALARVC